MQENKFSVTSWYQIIQTSRVFNAWENNSCICTNSYINLLSSGLETELPHFLEIHSMLEVKDSTGILTWLVAWLCKRLTLGLDSVEKYIYPGNFKYRKKSWNTERLTAASFRHLRGSPKRCLKATLKLFQNIVA